MFITTKRVYPKDGVDVFVDFSFHIDRLREYERYKYFDFMNGEKLKTKKPLCIVKIGTQYQVITMPYETLNFIVKRYYKQEVAIMSIPFSFN